VIAKHRAETEAGLEFGVRRVAGADCGRSVTRRSVSANERRSVLAGLSILCPPAPPLNAIIPFLDGAIVRTH